MGEPSASRVQGAVRNVDALKFDRYTGNARHMAEGQFGAGPDDRRFLEMVEIALQRFLLRRLDGVEGVKMEGQGVFRKVAPLYQGSADAEPACAPLFGQSIDVGS